MHGCTAVPASLVFRATGKKETNMHTTIEEHALKQGRYILILHGTPLHFIGTLDECKALKNKWDAKIRSHR